MYCVYVIKSFTDPLTGQVVYTNERMPIWLNR